MEPQPQLVLALMYWLHMVGTVVWIGGLVSLSILVIPAARHTLDTPQSEALIGKIQDRILTTGWFSLALLAVTGLFQMSSNPHYEGFLAIANPWAVAIFIKHLVYGGMIVSSAYLTWGLAPAKRRTLLRQAGGSDVSMDLARLRTRELWIARANLVIAAAILALTALARTS